MEPEVRPGWASSEFWITLAGKAAVAAVGLAVLFGKDPADANALGVAVEKGLVAVGVLAGIAWMVATYVKGRTATKVAASEARGVMAAANAPAPILQVRE